MLVRALGILQWQRPALADYCEVELPEGATLSDLCGVLGVSGIVGTMASVNGRLHSGDYVLREGDRVILFPPVSGGLTGHGHLSVPAG